ncbi:MAG TPA: tetratricopeptide repeat protein, partial [Roseiflexaceae bacterium]|nr:tetratricopeptide repeat protein [Roseiflexaceae bacterium]
VLVAPFQDTGGTVTQTGRSAAAQLVAALPGATSRHVIVQSIDVAPQSPEDAQRLLEQHRADVVVWGTITPGAMLDSPSLTPQLAYQPSGSFAPYAWQGYVGRFALPVVYPVAVQPINGKVVLPPLLDALAAYNSGDADRAVSQLTQLESDYPALDPLLPNVVLGSIYWAAGQHDAAAQSYQRAAQAGTALPPRELAKLYNDLGAVLQDAGNGQARAAFNQAITLLNSTNADLPELRFNLAIEARNTNDPVQAADNLRAAYDGLPPSTALLSAMGSIFREAGYVQRDSGQSMDDARETTAAIEAQVVRDTDQVPSDLRTLESTRLRALNNRELALTGLAQEIGLAGPMLWGLENEGDLNNARLRRLADQLDEAISQNRARARDWSKRSAAQDAAGRVAAGQIAANQSRQAEHDANALELWQVALAIKLGETQTPSERGFWGTLQGLADRKPLNLTMETIDRLQELNPRSVDLYLLEGHAHLKRNEPAEAAASFATAQSLAPERPDAYYGLALAALANGAQSTTSVDDARTLLNQALEREARFYPARFTLARIAEDAGDWPAAVEQRRRLYTDFPGERTALALSQALRRSGTNGLAEAEQILLPFANNDSVDALMELSRVYEASGDYPAAQAVLVRAQRIAPSNADVSYNLGLLAWRQGDRSDADRQFRLALTADRAYVPALLALAELHADDNALRTKYYRDALNAGADDVQQLTTIGNVLLQIDDPELARQAFDRAHELAPANAEARLGSARANLRLGELNTAETQANQVLTMANGNAAGAQIVLGEIALERGQADTAQAAFEEAQRINPNLGQVYVGLGRAAMLRGEWAVAAGHFRRAVAAEPDSAEAHRWLGDAQTLNGALREASAEYQQALEHQAAYPEALYGLARAQAALGDLETAQGNLNLAIKARPTYAEAMLLQGKIYEQLGQERQAMTSYQHAISANGKLAEPRYRRALLLVRQNKLSDARRELQAAVSAQPQFPEANYWLGRVEFADGRFRESLEWFQKAVEQARVQG